MRNYAQPGMTTKQLDDFGGHILLNLGAKSAPNLTYGFPGHTCISINNVFCHGIPSDKKILKRRDLVNIDVSAELDGFWSDNGGFVCSWGPTLINIKNLLTLQKKFYIKQFLI